MSRTEELNNTLADLRAASTEIEACAVISEDGLIIACSIPDDYEEGPVAAAATAILSSGIQAAKNLKRGTFQQLLVKGENGYVLVLPAGEKAALLALAGKNAKLGLFFLEVSRAAEELKINLT